MQMPPFTLPFIFTLFDIIPKARPKKQPIPFPRRYSILQSPPHSPRPIPQLRPRNTLPPLSCRPHQRRFPHHVHRATHKPPMHRHRCSNRRDNKPNPRIRLCSATFLKYSRRTDQDTTPIPISLKHNSTSSRPPNPNNLRRGLRPPLGSPYCRSLW